MEITVSPEEIQHLIQVIFESLRFELVDLDEANPNMG
jgi:hypothetical protein